MHSDQTDRRKFIHRFAAWSACSGLTGLSGAENSVTAPDHFQKMAGALRGEPLPYLINLGKKKQVIEHFGANDAWYSQMIEAWTEPVKNHVSDLLYCSDHGIGLSFCRFHVGGGINRRSIRDPWRTSDTFEVSEGNYDWSRLSGERWFLRAAKARGVRHFGMTIYSPPMRLTRSGLTNHGDDTTSSTNLKQGAEDAFADYLTDILVHFRDNPNESERIEFDRIFPHNEPKWDWQGTSNQEGCRASNDDIRRVHLSLARALRGKSLRTLIGAPESGSIPGMYRLDGQARAKWGAEYGNYIEFFSKDPKLAAALGGVMTYHGYWSDRVPEELVPHREKMANTLVRHPGWRLWQTEYCVMERGRDLGIDTALRVARVIHCDLAIAGASSWQWWLAISNENFKSSLIYTDYRKPGDETNVLPSKTLWALGNYSRFIRPGMLRVEVGGTQDEHRVMVSAYVDAPCRAIVVVCVNSGHEPALLDIGVLDQTGGHLKNLHFTPYVTSADSDLQAGAKTAGNSATIPARSIVTLVSRIAHPEIQ